MKKFLGVASLTPQVRHFLVDSKKASKILQVLLGIHVYNSVAYYFKKKDHPFMLYQACIRPYSFYEPPLELLTGRDFGFDCVLLLTYHFIVVIGNFYLFLFLKSQTENNTSLTGVDKKKERKRNFTSAKTGIISGFVMVISILIYSISYGLKVFWIQQYIHWDRGPSITNSTTTETFQQ